jgi:hypothetical protein
MGGACGTYARVNKGVEGCGGVNWSKEQVDRTRRRREWIHVIYDRRKKLNASRNNTLLVFEMKIRFLFREKTEFWCTI